MTFKLIKDNRLQQSFILRDQIQRAAISVMANISEGFGAFSNAEFARFLRIAHRSCLETQSHLYIFVDNDLIRREAFEEVYNHAGRCANIITGFIRYLRERK